jgi:hypothetical protein
VFGKSSLSIIFGPKKADLTREWIKLHNLELNDLNFRHNIVVVIKSRRMRWAGHIACMCEVKCLIGFWCLNRKGGDDMENLGVDGTIMLRWIFRT